MCWNIYWSMNAFFQFSNRIDHSEGPKPNNQLLKSIPFQHFHIKLTIMVFEPALSTEPKWLYSLLFYSHVHCLAWSFNGASWTQVKLINHTYKHRLICVLSWWLHKLNILLHMIVLLTNLCSRLTRQYPCSTLVSVEISRMIAVSVRKQYYICN